MATLTGSNPLPIISGIETEGIISFLLHRAQRSNPLPIISGIGPGKLPGPTKVWYNLMVVIFGIWIVGMRLPVVFVRTASLF